MRTYKPHTTFAMAVRERGGQRGAALVLALSMLVLFGILGTCYLRYMNLTVVEGDMDLRRVRAEQLAAAGIQVAVEALRQEVLQANRYVDRGVTREFSFNTYGAISHGDEGVSGEAIPGNPRLAIAGVTIHDESGRVNINHAPAEVLQRLMGIDAATARKIAEYAAPGGQGQPFLSLDELVTRNLLSQSQYDALNLSNFTVYSAPGSQPGAGYFNVNEASPAVLAAVLGLSEEQATRVKSAAGDGFTSLAAFGQAVASVTGAPATSVEGNASLGLVSRCFRVVSEGRYAKLLDEGAYQAAAPNERGRYLSNSASGRVEAVVLFGDDGTYEILHWRRGRGDAGGEA